MKETEEPSNHHHLIIPLTYLTVLLVCLGLSLLASHIGAVVVSDPAEVAVSHGL
jgi:GMP synthase-like glutamine amidotransferase